MIWSESTLPSEERGGEKRGGRREEESRANEKVRKRPDRGETEREVREIKKS